MFKLPPKFEMLDADWLRRLLPGSSRRYIIEFPHKLMIPYSQA